MSSIVGFRAIVFNVERGLVYFEQVQRDECDVQVDREPPRFHLRMPEEWEISVGDVFDFTLESSGERGARL